MKIIPNIYKIDKLHNQIKTITNTDAVIRSILTHSYKKSNKSFDPENVNITSYTKDDIKYFLYTYRVNDKESDWSTFLPSELKGDETFSQSRVNLVMFIEINHDLFAIIGGATYWLIAGFIDHLFGLMTYDRIISLEYDEAVSTKSRSITGPRAGYSEQFRDDYRMFNYLQFGKVPKELHIKLANDTSTTYFDFLLNKPTERLQVAVGRSFKFNKEIDFDYLHRLANKLSIISKMPPQELLSSYIHVRDGESLMKLRRLLNDKVYNNIRYALNLSNDPRDAFEFDFCNPNKIQEFYEAERYELVEKTESGRKVDGLFATVLDKSEIYKKVVERAYGLYGDNQQSIEQYMYGVMVYCYIGKKMTASSGFMYHFNAEFAVGNDAVFLVDSKWYVLKESFVESLKLHTERIFRNSKLSINILDQKWTFDTVRLKFTREGDYNLLYNGREGYIVLDTIIEDGIELCDILFISSTELYLIHVKHSFTSRVRELTNQILISGRRLREAIASKQKTFFYKIFDALIAKDRSTNNLNKDDFYNMFLLKKPVYVFATASQLAQDLPIENNMDRYDSNIARFSLTTCSSEMQTNYYELKTFQIPRG